MEIKTKKDIEKLNFIIKTELGIDIEKYRNEEAVESFVELLSFQIYFLTGIIRPIIISVIIFIVGFFIIDLSGLGYLFYGIVGLCIFPITGIQIGLLLITKKMKSDIWRVLDYSLETMNSALNDVSKTNKNKSLDLLFKGIIHIVAIPVLSKVISKKIPVIGSFLSKIIKKILALVSDKINFDGESPEEKREIDSGQDYLGSKITLASKRIEKVLSSSISIVQLPIKIGLAITSSILVIFIYLIN